LEQLRMTSGNRFLQRTLVVVSIMLCTAFLGGVHAQSAPPSSPNSSDQAPIVMTECEGIDNCTKWTFLGKQGTAQWRTGEVGILSIVSVNVQDKTIKIHRVDATGTKAGLTADYTGNLRNDRMGGEFESNWPGHWKGKTENWYAIVGSDAPALPSVMHMCLRDDHSSCATFKLEDGRYTNYTNLPGQWGEKSRNGGKVHRRWSCL